jgi:chitosanase
MSISASQKLVIDSVLSIFETGRIPSPLSYQTCTILSDGAGISYGTHQSTDRSGSLDKIVDLYIHKGGLRAADLQQYMQQLANNETAKVDPKNPPAWVVHLVGLLKEAGKDPIMQAAQDEVFDSCYWVPAVGHAKSAGLQLALSHLVVYDTCIQSGPAGVASIRARFPEASPANGGDEKAWVQAYVNARRAWLASYPNPIVQKTVYRMDELNLLIKSGNWDLTTPMVVRGVKIG